MQSYQVRQVITSCVISSKPSSDKLHRHMIGKTLTHLWVPASRGCTSCSGSPGGRTHPPGLWAWTESDLWWSGGWAGWSSWHPHGRWGHSRWPHGCAGGSSGQGSRPEARSAQGCRPRRCSLCICPSGSCSDALCCSALTSAHWSRCKLKIKIMKNRCRMTKTSFLWEINWILYEILFTE